MFLFFLILYLFVVRERECFVLLGGRIFAYVSTTSPRVTGKNSRSNATGMEEG